MNNSICFVVLILIFSIAGVILALLNNDLVIEKPTNFFLQKKYNQCNQLINDIIDEKELHKKIKEKEEELQKADEERKKKIEEEFKKIFYEEKKQKEEELKRKMEEDKRKKE